MTMVRKGKTSSIQYEMRFTDSNQNTISGSLQNTVVLPENMEKSYSYEEKANKTDCIIALSSGILTGLLDIF